MAQWPPADQPAEPVADGRTDRGRDARASCSSARWPADWSARSSPPGVFVATDDNNGSTTRVVEQPAKTITRPSDTISGSLDVAGIIAQGGTRGRRDHDRRRARQRRRRGDRLRPHVRRLHRDQQPRDRERQQDQRRVPGRDHQARGARRARPGDRSRRPQGERDGPAVGHPGRLRQGPGRRRRRGHRQRAGARGRPERHPGHHLRHQPPGRHRRRLAALRHAADRRRHQPGQLGWSRSSTPRAR